MKSGVELWVSGFGRSVDRLPLRSSAPLLLLLCLIFAGCQPPTQTVYVDVAEVLATDRIANPAVVASPAPPRPIPSITVVQPGRPPESLRDPSRSSESDLQQVMARRQHEDLVALTARLRQYYTADAQRFEQDELRTQDRAALKAYGDANDQIREIFETYADKRAPLVASLSLLVGFPDPNPESKPPPTPMRPVEQKLFDSAKDLRAQIHDLEANFDAEERRILDAVAAKLGQDLSALEEKVRQRRIANDARAEREARLQVPETVRALGLNLTEPMRLALSGLPPRATTLPAAPAPQPAPQVSSEGVLAKPQDRELLIRRQIQIWAAQRRLVVSAKPGPKDETREFIAWRNGLLAGR